MEPRHHRRSSLTEALQEELQSESASATPEASRVSSKPEGLEPQTDAGSPQAARKGKTLTEVLTASPPAAGLNGRTEAAALSIFEPQSEAERQVEQSPFTPDDSLSYVLCADGPRKSTSSSTTLETVPEDSASSPSGEGGMQQLRIADLKVVGPDAMHLPPVRTPRRSPTAALSSEDDPGNPELRPAEQTHEQERRNSTGSGEDSFSIDFSRRQSEALDNAFNPFADSSETGFSASPQANASQTEDSFFAMEMDSLGQQPSQGTPFVAHLDFGARAGSGVVGPKIVASESGRMTDKFEVKEGEDAEIKQLLWVIENLQEELHLSGKALELADSSAQERQALVSRLQAEYADAEIEEAELDEKLRVLHSKLEAQLLTKLEQEEESRISGDRLRSVKTEILLLDEALSRAELQRRDLERQAGEKRAVQRRETPEKALGGSPEARVDASPKSNYSSAWGTSDSEEDESLDLQNLAAPRPSTSIFEENHAKLKEKGGLGGSWLRSVLSGKSKKDFEAGSGHLRAPVDAALPGSSEQNAGFGAGQSHFQQPSTAAELAPEPETDDSGTQQPAVAANSIRP